MRMDELGYNHRHDRNFYIDRPQGAGDWLLLIVKSPAMFRIDGVERHLPGKFVILYTPDYPQYYHSESDEYYDDWIHFGPDEEELALMRAMELPFNKPFPLQDITDISGIVKHMCYEQYSDNPHRQESVDLYFRLLIYKLHEKLLERRSCTKVSETVYFEKLLWIRESIYRWPSRNYSVDDMAADLSLSRSRFQHLYSETFGTSVKADVIKSRMEKACALLRTSTLSVKEIGTLIGYGNTSYFVRMFGNVFGMTPVQYREKSHLDPDAEEA